jgi:aspartate beta-hydroxylase
MTLETNEEQEINDLHSSALDLMKRQEFKSALVILEELVANAPDHLAAWTNLAGIKRLFGDFDGALAAVGKTLEIMPRSFFGLLLRGSIFEQMGQYTAAARAYEIALAVQPPQEQLDEITILGLKKTRDFLDRVNSQKFNFLQQSVLELQTRADPELKTRVDALIGNLTGRRKAYVQNPLVFNFPHMPSIEFWEKSEFPWLEEMESQTQNILEEFTNILIADGTKSEPYMKYATGLPLDQLEELNNNLDWTAYHLIERGQVVPENASRCPKTISALTKLPQPQLKGRTPVALFSILKPHTHIPPHTGASNIRLLCHLPLVIPPDCSFRVGGTWREWRLGETLIFDDTIEHEAKNDSNQARAVLIFDVENPRLKPQDYEAIRLVTEALDEFDSHEVTLSSWT